MSDTTRYIAMSLFSSASPIITPETAGNAVISPLSGRFRIINLFLLIVSGIGFFWLSRNESWDIALSRYWFDPLTLTFPWKNNLWLEWINHRLLKYMVILAGSMLLLTGIFRRQPRLILTALLMAAGMLTVGILKASSAHSCPWSLQAFGGTAAVWPLLGNVPADSGPGRCFPGGHASCGFSLMALFFLYWPTRPRIAWALWIGAIVLGLAMGWGQVMRGAHFLTHNLWSGWWVWLTQYLIQEGVCWRAKRKKVSDHTISLSVIKKICSGNTLPPFICPVSHQNTSAPEKSRNFPDQPPPT